MDFVQGRDNSPSVHTAAKNRPNDSTERTFWDLAATMANIDRGAGLNGWWVSFKPALRNPACERLCDPLWRDPRESETNDHQLR
jgi:hypothetical protein